MNKFIFWHSVRINFWWFRRVFRMSGLDNLAVDKYI